MDVDFRVRLRCEPGVESFVFGVTFDPKMNPGSFLILLISLMKAENSVKGGKATSYLDLYLVALVVHFSWSPYGNFSTIGFIPDEESKYAYKHPSLGFSM